MIHHWKKLLLIVILLAAGMSVPYSVSASTPQKIAVPAYFYPCTGTPGCYWDRLDNSAAAVGFVIMNPASGAGVSIDPNYVAQVKRTHAAGIRIIGYVNTAGGKRAVSQVEADITKYYKWYQVDGIFFDLASTSCLNQPYYKMLYKFVKAQNAARNLVVLNPGWNMPECYVSVSDVIVNFEGYYSTYVTWQPSGWEVKYPAGHFWQIVHTTSALNLQAVVNKSKARHAGLVFVTSALMPNPYNMLPPPVYWNNEIKYTQQ
jgi:hypothetical protein